MDKAQHTRVPFWFPPIGQSDTFKTEALRHYRETAVLANTDPYVAKLFEESPLWLDEPPDGALDLLLEHPILRQAYSGNSRHEFRSVQALARGPSDAKFLFSHLAKLSARTGQFICSQHHQPYGSLIRIDRRRSASEG